MKNWRKYALLLVLVAIAFIAGHVNPAHAMIGVAGVTQIPDIDEVQKIIYDGAVIDQVVTDSELMDQFLESTSGVEVDETTGGYYIKTASILALPGGVTSAVEGDYLPQGDAAKFANSIIYLRKYVALVGPISGDVMDRIKEDDGAFLDYMDKVMPWTVERLTNLLDSDYIGYGAGIRSRAAGTPTNTGVNTYTLEVDSALGVDGYDDAWLHHLANERIVFSDTAPGTAIRAGGALGRSALVNDADPEPNATTGAHLLTLTMDSTLAGNIADNDFIANGDSVSTSFQAGGVDRSLQGLLAAVDDGDIVDTYLGVDRSIPANRPFKALVIDGSTSPWDGEMSEDLLVYADERARKVGVGKADLIVMSDSAYRGYWKSLRGDRVFSDPQKYTGGIRPLEIALTGRIVRLRVARKLPPQLVFGLQRDTFTRYHLGRFKWDSKTGSLWNRVTDSTGRKDEFYATGYMREQLACRQPMKNWRIDGLERVQ